MTPPHTHIRYTQDPVTNYMEIPQREARHHIKGGNGLKVTGRNTKLAY